MIAAQVAHTFKIDPLAVLDVDPVEFEIRHAAARAMWRMMKEDGGG